MTDTYKVTNEGIFKNWVLWKSYDEIEKKVEATRPPGTRLHIKSEVEPIKPTHCITYAILALIGWAVVWVLVYLLLTIKI